MVTCGVTPVNSVLPPWAVGEWRRLAFRSAASYFGIGLSLGAEVTFFKFFSNILPF